MFSRVSGYRLEELVGQPHNVIRHPEMPRAAFRLVWDYLKHSRRVAALVKNLASDGCHYWVVAMLVPARDGFLSIRFKPTGPRRDAIVPVYAAMLAEEERILADGGEPAKAMDAATEILLHAVRGWGFPDYDAFMRALLCEELKSRDAVLAAERCSVVPALEQPDGEAGDLARASLRALQRDALASYRELSRLFTRLDEFVALKETLERQASFVENLTRELRLAAMNASLASSRAGSEAQTLGVVSFCMGQGATEVGGAVSVLTRDIRAVAGKLRSVVFNLAVGRLEIEMALTFLVELIDRRATADEESIMPRAVPVLQQVFLHSVERARVALDELERGTQSMTPAAARLSRHMLELQVAHLAGVMEATRIADQSEFGAVFGHIRILIEDARKQLAGLGEVLHQLAAIVAHGPQTARELVHAATGLANVAQSLPAELSTPAAPAAFAETPSLPAPRKNPRPAPCIRDRITDNPRVFSVPVAQLDRAAVS